MRRTKCETLSLRIDFLKKTAKKSLTKDLGSDILVKLARTQWRKGRAKRTLKTIQREKRAIKERDSEDSKELNIERC